MRAILIRVGIDQTDESGNWNAPCNPQTGDFVYVPIREPKPNVAGMEKRYKDFAVPALEAFSKRNKCDEPLPAHLNGERMHLDPDFENLTYGDTEKRGKKLLEFERDDLIVFFASLKSVTDNNLIYALIGLLTVKEIIRAGSIPKSEWDKNAHTRRAGLNPKDVVVRANPKSSGRLAKYIPIGELRERAYRVTNPLLMEWGGLSVKNGYLQRSANPPLLNDAERFYKWFQSQKPQLLRKNNP